MNNYIESVIERVERRDADKPEFIQCVKEVLRSLENVIEEHPEYVEDDILGRMVESDRFIVFRVAWLDDAGKTQINRGFRVQFNSAIGPYKGGLRFHPTVNSWVLNRFSKTRLPDCLWAAARADRTLTPAARAIGK